MCLLRKSGREWPRGKFGFSTASLRPGLQFFTTTREIWHYRNIADHIGLFETTNQIAGNPVLILFLTTKLLLLLLLFSSEFTKV
jgi:hypothetical protein